MSSVNRNKANSTVIQTLPLHPLPSLSFVPVVPCLKRKERPELLSVVPRPLQVVVDQPLHLRHVKKPIPPDPLRRQHVQQLPPQRPPKPLRDRNPKPLLRPV